MLLIVTTDIQFDFPSVNYPASPCSQMGGLPGKTRIKSDQRGDSAPRKIIQIYFQNPFAKIPAFAFYL